MSPGWVGCDLDGTLAEYHGWDGGAIGAPVPKMVARIKEHLDDGEEVRILTARVAVPEGLPATARLVREQEVREERQKIREWTERHLGTPLRATAQKDYLMVLSYDDRVKQVVPNTGELVEEIERR